MHLSASWTERLAPAASSAGTSGAAEAGAADRTMAARQLRRAVFMRFAPYHGMDPAARVLAYGPVDSRAKDGAATALARGPSGATCEPSARTRQRMPPLPEGMLSRSAREWILVS